MKKRILATLMAMFMVGAVVGCGDGSTAPESQESIRNVTLNEEKLERPEQQESDTETEASSSITKEDNSTADNEDDTTADDDDSSIANIDDSKELETEGSVAVNGIILMASWLHGNNIDDVIFSVNPDTGVYTELACFNIGLRYDSYYYSLPKSHYYGNEKQNYSRDYSKLAMTKTIIGADEQHAGWLTSSGEFFDIVEELKLEPDNEFEARKQFYSLGFSEEGYFVFVELNRPYSDAPDFNRSAAKEGTFYYVSPDNPEVLYEGNPILETDLNGVDIGLIITHTTHGFITDRINDDEFLANYNVGDCNNTIIRKLSDESYIEELVPGEARFNWSGIVGPDNKIAFLSRVNNKMYDIGLYVIERGESSPQRVLDCTPLMDYGGRKSETFVSGEVLDWR